MKRVFIVHKWEGTPSADWYPWLKKELDAKGFETHILEMPETEEPKIEKWVPFLKEKVRRADSDTYLVGHSIGCQTILRYLELIDTKVGGSVLVAGFVKLHPLGNDEEETIAKPWITTPINWDKVKNNCDGFLCIFSDNDPYVPLDNADFFREKFNAEIIIQKEKGHFTKKDGVIELPVVVEFFKKI